MISGLEGWQFLAPKGLQRIRPQDHAMIQPMFQVQLVKQANGKVPAEGLEDDLPGTSSHRSHRSSRPEDGPSPP